MIKDISSVFTEKFSGDPLIVKSPGRINIIGEHTDYNEGFVLPGAIDKGIYVAIDKNQTEQINLFAVHFNESYSVSLNDITPQKSWPTYILGVVFQLQQKGYPVKGFNMVIDGDVPVGAGLSSSAAVECAVVFALNQLFNFGLSKMEMVLIAQKAEHTFSGVLCGIMDMFASMFGKKNQVIKLDCRSLEYSYKPIQLGDYSLVLFNTNVKHSLASSAYNERRQQCEQGVAWVKELHPLVNSLRDINLDMLKQCVLENDKLIYQRCKFVVEEIQRLQDACIDLEKGNIRELGVKLFATHKGLSEDYEVSCSELDFLIENVKDNPAVAGARMMGGGFGGCTINIVLQKNLDELIENLSRKYKQEMHRELSPILVNIENGTSVIKSQNRATV
ncbi:MAG: galactokinase [Daejeonella sp.]